MPYNIYRTLQPTVLDVRKGHVKARMTTRTYIHCTTGRQT